MFELETIKKRGRPYLKRWRILGYLTGHEQSEHYDQVKTVKSKLPFRVNLHQFFQRDLDGCCHNHPWKWAISFGLRGSYTEQRINPISLKSSYKTYNAPFVNFLTHSDFHQITEIKGNPITLFISGPKAVDDWGFLWEGQFTNWRTFLNVKD